MTTINAGYHIIFTLSFLSPTSFNACTLITTALDRHHGQWGHVQCRLMSTIWVLWRASQLPVSSQGPKQESLRAKGPLFHPSIVISHSPFPTSLHQSVNGHYPRSTSSPILINNEVGCINQTADPLQIITGIANYLGIVFRFFLRWFLLGAI